MADHTTKGESGDFDEWLDEEPRPPTDPTNPYADLASDDADDADGMAEWMAFAASPGAESPLPEPETTIAEPTLAGHSVDGSSEDPGEIEGIEPTSQEPRPPSLADASNATNDHDLNNADLSDSDGDLTQSFEEGLGLRFRLGSISVKIDWSFIFIAILGFGSFTVLELAAWVGGVLVAVLLHEMGHAVSARRFGVEPVWVTVFAFGGLTSFPPESELSPGQRFIMTAAGSGVGILAGGALLLAIWSGAFDAVDPVAWAAIDGFVLASLFWGVFNWLPIRPLDGGRMLFTFLDLVAPRAADGVSKAVSLIVGGAAVAAGFIIGDPFMAFFIGFIVFTGLRTPMKYEPESLSEDAAPVAAVPPSDVATVGGAPRRHRTAIMMALSLLGTFAVVGGLVWVISRHADNISTLEPADCFDVPDSIEITNVSIVDCAVPHQAEVFANLGLEGDEYPDEFTWDIEIFERCRLPFEEYVGSKIEESVLMYSFLYPTEPLWNRGNRTLTCVLHDGSSALLTGSMKDSGI